MSQSNPNNEEIRDLKDRYLADMQQIKDTEDSRKTRLEWLLKVGSLALAIFGAIGTFFVTQLVGLSSAQDTNLEKRLTSEIEMVRAELKTLDAKLSDRFAALQAQPSNSQGPNIAHLNSVQASLADTQTKLTNLEKAITDNPQKALEVPLLKKDLDALKESSRSDLLLIRQEIERVYDLSKWFLGLMITSLIAIIGLAISSLFKKSSGASSAAT